MTPWQLWGLPTLAAIVTVIVTAVAFRQKEGAKEQPQEQSEAAKGITEARRKALKRDDQTAKWFELLKLEYEKAADRYENIYKAIWQNFSYMALRLPASTP